MKTEQELLAEAQSDFLHNASNLSGVVHAFSRMISELCLIARENNKGTEWINRHKITQLWIAKLSDLSGYEWLDSLEKSALYAD